MIPLFLLAISCIIYGIQLLKSETYKPKLTIEPEIIGTTPKETFGIGLIIIGGLLCLLFIILLFIR